MLVLFTSTLPFHLVGTKNHLSFFVLARQDEKSQLFLWRVFGFFVCRQDRESLVIVYLNWVENRYFLAADDLVLNWVGKEYETGSRFGALRVTHRSEIGQRKTNHEVVVLARLGLLYLVWLDRLDYHHLPSRNVLALQHHLTLHRRTHHHHWN